MLTFFRSLRLYPPVLPYSGCQWMRGNYWVQIDKCLELALWDDGAFTIMFSQDEGDCELINWTIQTPFRAVK